jgi:hypothetical protein
MKPVFTSREEFDALYDELLAAAKALHWTPPSAADYCLGERGTVD